MIRPIVLVVTALAAAALAAGCGGDDDDANVAWADGVCSSVSTWIDSVEAAAESLRSEGSVEERVDAAVEDVEEATDALGDDLRALGEPEVGEQATATLEELLGELADGVDTIERALSGGEGLEALSTIGTTVAAMSEAVSSTVDELEGLEGGETLRDAFDEADSCRDLRSARS